MIARFIKDGEVRGGSYSDEHGIVSGGEVLTLSDVTLLTPCRPSKIVCVGLNYAEHARELNMALPEEPILFLKPPTAAMASGGSIVYPPSCRQLDYEGELAAVIGKRCKDVRADEAEEFILGYTCFNDVTARDLQNKDGQWTRAKSFDTFAPFGPWIGKIDPGDVDIKTRLNGNVVQNSNTSDLIFDVPYLVQFISSVMTLEPGDVIATGTPPGVGAMQRGDTVEVEIEGIGILKNSVI
ncbi:MAG TPA: fumarylacetoacetate hydrolase family protein [Methanothrix sp.]|nr:fumarylacetoacetate hydrolase family protein [Methanothrix sp.]HPC89999.1 fumarylacetoacetate hydrolase family protein [Methanothrix sp.]HQE87768.1 fumarylacetoacetate hydrolase family protein [Methanothrix sp.]HQI68291.1 fumarylacetoacetate hydrolase family protein [Methanothrix sp.]HRS85786.1 fumarylacetoacetate hydrolase family protein [Methanothrix sp.]